MTLYHGAFISLGNHDRVRIAALRSDAPVRPRIIWLPMVAFLVLLNTSESVATKTTLIAKFAVILLCLYRRRPAASRLSGAGGVRPRAAMIAGSKACEVSSIMPMPSNKFQNVQGKPNVSALSRTSRI